tara:strand:+ start:876 stop:1760 length:885 start_codon:yes stop_codon:yes gene_type:complete
VINLKLIKKGIFAFDKIFLNSYFRKIYNLIKYNLKVWFINFSSKKIINKKRHILKKKLVISLTSHPARFKTLPLTLNSILKQSVQADKIILWIEKKDKKKIPFSVSNLNGIFIKYCENSLISYSKIIPTLRRYRDCYIITIDDDFIYHNKLIENLVYKSSKYPNDIIANRIHKIRIINKQPTKYMSWYLNFKKDTKLAFFTGTGGVLYPPNCFYKDVLKVKYFKKLAPLGDDIWLNWMARIKGTNVRRSNYEKTSESIKSITGGLYKKNIKQNYNDVQIKNMINKYGFPFKIKN